MELNTSYSSPTMPYNIKESINLNEPDKLTFSVLKSNNNSNANFKIGQIIELNNIIYLVEDVQEKVDDNNKVILEIECVQNNINLSRLYTKKKEYENVNVIDVLREIIKDTGWRLGNTNITSPILISYKTTTREVVLPVLVDIMSIIQGVLIFNKDTIDVYIGGVGSLEFSDNSLVNSVNSSLDEGDVITRLFPYGAEQEGADGDKTKLNVSSVNNGKEYIDNFSYFYSLGYEEEYIKNNIYMFLRMEEYNNENISDPNKLLQEGVDYLESHSVPKFESTIVVNDLINVNLNSTRLIYDTQRNIYVECRVVSYVKDYDNMTTTIVLKDRICYSSYDKTISGKIDKVSNKVNDNWNTIIDEAVQKATDFINNGINGYVVANENEILIMDSNDKNTAKDVWRFNKNGLMFSSTGYEGNYMLAMTKDGQIVADAITSGTFNAELIKAGILQSSEGSTWIDISNGTFSLANGIVTYDGVDFKIQQDEVVNANLIYDGTFIEGLDFWVIEGNNIEYEGAKPEWMPRGEGVGIMGVYNAYRGIRSNMITIQTNQRYTLSFNYQVESNVTSMIVYAYLYDKNRNYIGAINLGEFPPSDAYINTAKTIEVLVSDDSAKYIAIEFRNNGLRSVTTSYTCCYLNRVKLETGETLTTYIGNELIMNSTEILSKITKQMGGYVTESKLESYCDTMRASVLEEVQGAYVSKTDLTINEAGIINSVSTTKDNYPTQAEFNQTVNGIFANFKGGSRNIIPNGGFEAEVSTTYDSLVDFPDSIDGVGTVDKGRCFRISYDNATDVYVVITNGEFALESGETYTISGYARNATERGTINSSCYITNTRYGGTTNIPIFSDWNVSYSEWSYLKTTFTVPSVSINKWDLRLGYKNSEAVYTWVAFDQIMLVEGKSPAPFNCGEDYYSTDLVVGKNGIKCGYPNGAYTEMSPSGFRYCEAGGSYSYCSLVTYGVCTVYPTCNDAVSSVTITLPSVFKNKDLSTVISFNQVDIPVLEAGGNSYYTMIGLTMGASASTDPVNGTITIHYRFGFPRGLLYEGNIAHDGYGTDTARLIINYTVFGRY